ncbi:MAG: 50S ribosomal protein L17 [bacterium]|nr:50S ribosomal protein L17 [bacterium]
MRHRKRGRKLGRTASHRKAMLNNLATSLFEHGKIHTTLPKAKELCSVAERLISFAKRGDLHARRQVLRRIQNKIVVSKLFDEIGPSYSERNGGYTRVLKIGPRRGDSTEICLVELVGDEIRAEYADTGSEAARAVATEVVVETDPEDVSEETSEVASDQDSDDVEASDASEEVEDADAVEAAAASEEAKDADAEDADAEDADSEEKKDT